MKKQFIRYFLEFLVIVLGISISFYLEKQNAIKQIQTEMSNVVILASEKLIGKNLDSKDNKKFTEKVISELEKN